MENRRIGTLRALALAAAFTGAGAVASLGGAAAARTAHGSSSTALTTAKAKPGKAIFTSAGRAVYMFSRDTRSHSSCSGKCAATWPPLTGSATVASRSGLNPKLLGKMQRGGQTQVTYNGHPLYLFSGDKKSHSTKGEGQKAFGGSWFLLSPRGGALKPKQKFCSTVCQGY